jgi:hypothetical protein
MNVKAKWAQEEGEFFIAVGAKLERSTATQKGFSRLQCDFVIL